MQRGSRHAGLIAHAAPPGQCASPAATNKLRTPSRPAFALNLDGEPAPGFGKTFDRKTVYAAVVSLFPDCSTELKSAFLTLAAESDCGRLNFKWSVPGRPKCRKTHAKFQHGHGAKINLQSGKAHTAATKAMSVPLVSMSTPRCTPKRFQTQLQCNKNL